MQRSLECRCGCGQLSLDAAASHAQALQAISGSTKCFFHEPLDILQPGPWIEASQFPACATAGGDMLPRPLFRRRRAASPEFMLHHSKFCNPGYLLKPRQSQLAVLGSKKKCGGCMLTSNVQTALQAVRGQPRISPAPPDIPQPGLRKTRPATRLYCWQLLHVLTGLAPES